MPDSIGLPARGKKRWRASDKAAIVQAIRDGEITIEAAVERYNSSPEELATWANTLGTHGLQGLKATSNAVHWYRGRKSNAR